MHVADLLPDFHCLPQRLVSEVPKENGVQKESSDDSSSHDAYRDEAAKLNQTHKPVIILYLRRYIHILSEQYFVLGETCHSHNIYFERWDTLRAFEVYLDLKLLVVEVFDLVNKLSKIRVQAVFALVKA